MNSGWSGLGNKYTISALIDKVKKKKPQKIWSVPTFSCNSMGSDPVGFRWMAVRADSTATLRVDYKTAAVHTHCFLLYHASQISKLYL